MHGATVAVNDITISEEKALKWQWMLSCKSGGKLPEVY